MTCLSVFHPSSLNQPDKVLTHLDDINATLAPHGITLGRWQPGAVLSRGATEADVLAAYAVAVQRLAPASARVVETLPAGGQRSRGALSLGFAAGRAQVAMHLGGYCYALLCEKHDLLSLPAGQVFCLDAGEQPRVTAVLLDDGQPWECVAGAYPAFDG